MKRSTQWDLVGVFALVMTIVSVYSFLFLGKASYEGINKILLPLGNPFLFVVFLLFSVMCFIFAYFEGKKEERRA